MLTQAQGKQLLNLARLALNSSFGKLSGLKLDLKHKKIKTKSKTNPAALSHSFLEEERGIFVTLTKDGELRGCIGFPEPIFPLGVAALRAARSAAFEDHRFQPLQASEVDKVKIEVTVLTTPKQIEVKSQKDLAKIKIGRDGLIVRQRGYSGLLLPQVATEYGWKAEEFLEHTCQKAGLPKNAWLSPDTKVFKFQGQIFKE